MNILAKQVMGVAKEVMAWGGRMNFPRSFYIPQTGVNLQQLPDGKDLDLEFWSYEDANGNLYGLAFGGKANKPLWHYRFRDKGRMDGRIEETIAIRRSHTESVQKRQQERLQFKHGLKQDDILTSSWGYDQTNVDFYQVIEVGEKSVRIREVGSKVVRSEQGSDYVVAVPNHFKGPVMTKIVRPGDRVRLTSYSSASKWDGQPKYETAFGYGH